MIGLTVMVGAPAAKSTVPLIAAVVATLLDETVMRLPPFASVRTPPVATDGLAPPPLLLKVRLVRLFAPASVAVELPFSVKACGATLPGVLATPALPAVVVRLPRFNVMPLPPAG